MPGSKTVNLPFLSAVDEIIGNDTSVPPGNVGRIPIDALAVQLAASPAIGIGVNSGIKIFLTKEDMDLDLLSEPDFGAWVMNDPDPDNNMAWAKTGASGVAGWEIRGRLPFDIIQMNNAGAGTANAIQITTAVAMPSAAYAAIYNLNITADNTDVVTINGKPLKTNTGVEVPFGTLTAGSSHLLFDAGAYYQLFTDGNTYKTFIELLNVGAGTANDLVVTTAQGIPSDAGKSLFLLEIVVPNPGAMTLSINGLVAKPMVTLKGDPISPGYFSAGMSVILADTGTTYKLYTPGDIVAEVLALRNEAETLKDEAEAARDVTTGLANGVILADNKWASKASAEAWSPVAAPDYIQIKDWYYDNKGEFEPWHKGKLSITLDDGITVVWFEIANKTLTSFMFGAIGDKVADDAPALFDCFVASNALGRGVVIPKPDVAYRLASGRYYIYLTSNLNIECQDAVFFYDHDASGIFQFEPVEAAVPVFTGTVDRGEFTFNVDDTTDIQIGDLVSVDSTKEWELQWNYQQRETHIVDDVTATTITFEDKVVFNYDAATDGVVLSARRPIAINWSGNLTINYATAKKGFCLAFTHLANSIFDGISVVDKTHPLLVDPVSIARSINSVVTNYYTEGMHYGIIITSGSCNVNIDGIVGIHNRHPFDYSVGARNSYVKNATGYKNVSTLQTHASINISFYNIKAYGDERFEHRCIGGKIEGFDFETDFAVASTYTQSLNLIAEYDGSLSTDLYGEYDYDVKDVKIIAPNATVLVGFNPHGNCPNSHFDNCKMPTMQATGTNSQTVMSMSDCFVHSIGFRGKHLDVVATKIQFDYPNMPVAMRQDAVFSTLSSGTRVTMSGGSMTGGHDYVFRSYHSTKIVKLSNVYIEGITTDFLSGTGSPNVVFTLTACTFDTCTFPMTTGNSASQFIKTTDCDYIGGSGKLKSQIQGFVNQPADASALILIPHGLYAAPKFVSLGTKGTTVYSAQVKATDATNITVQVLDVNNALRPSLTAHVFYEARI